MTDPASKFAPTPDPRGSFTAAVHSCCTVYHQVLAVERGKGLSNFEAGEKATEAYCNAIPYLVDHASIRDFIACVGHGMLLKIIPDDHGAKLLYAAQTALGAVPREVKSAGRPKF